MNMIKVYTVGEDDVTRAVLRRVLHYCNKQCNRQFEIVLELPARGGQINSKLQEFDKLSNSFPVILLTDLDANSCAPELLQKLFPQGKSNRFVFNIAVDEVEAWLMADLQGFSDYFALDINDLPKAKAKKQGAI